MNITDIIVPAFVRESEHLYYWVVSRQALEGGPVLEYNCKYGFVETAVTPGKCHGKKTIFTVIK